MTSAISVKDRLKNYAVASGKTMQEVLILYGLERTIYRVSISDYAEFFTLKGGILLYGMFRGEFARVTRDIDLLAMHITNDSDHMRGIFEKIFSISCDDALRYDLDTLELNDITEFKKYHGVNVSITAFLDRTKVPISIDIGFGDVIYPDRARMDFPVLLDMEAPEIFAYSIYSVIAEKFEAIVSLGDANSRYKDFYDIYMIAGKYQLEGRELQAAIQETFSHRGTGYEDIIVFEDTFADSVIHKNRWNAFRKKKLLLDIEFAEVLRLLKVLLAPVIDSIRQGNEFTTVWNFVNGKWEQ